MSPESITKEAYDQWTPTAVVSGMLWKEFSDGPVANGAILRRLGTGHLLAAYEHGIWKNEDGLTRDQYYGVISETLWNAFAPDNAHTFWRTGDADVWPRSFGYQISAASAPIVTLIGVRFDPAGLAKMLNLPDPTVIENTPENFSIPLKALPSAEYANISNALVAGWGIDLSEERAWEMAKAMFPHHRVIRELFLGQFRAIRGPKKRGKQPLSE